MHSRTRKRRSTPRTGPSAPGATGERFCRGRRPLYSAKKLLLSPPCCRAFALANHLSVGHVVTAVLVSGSQQMSLLLCAMSHFGNSTSQRHVLCRENWVCC